MSRFAPSPAGEGWGEGDFDQRLKPTLIPTLVPWEKGSNAKSKPQHARGV